MLTIHNTTHNESLAESVRCCHSLWSRFKGLLGTSALKESEACWLVPCNSVHSIGMRYPIDVYFLNKKNEVVGMWKNMKPNRISSIYLNAHSVLELPASSNNQCAIGDRLAFEEKKVPPTVPKARAHTGFSKLFQAKGQAAVEMALATVFFFAFLFMMTDLVKVCYGWASLQYAVNEAARQSSLGNADEALKTARNIALKFVPNVQVDALEDYFDNGGVIHTRTISSITGTSSPTKNGSSYTGSPSTYVILKAQSQITMTPVSDTIWYILGQRAKTPTTIYAETIIRNEPFTS